MARVQGRTLRARPRRRDWAPPSLVACIFVLAACGEDGRDHTLVVHSSLSPSLLEFVERSFESAHPDVDVSVVQAADSQTLGALRSGGDAPVDVWWGAAPTALAAARQADLLQAYRPAWIRVSDAHDPDGFWHASLASPVVVAFDRERVPLARAPTDWIDLFHFRWFGEIAMTDPTVDPEAAYFVGAMIVRSLRADGDLTRAFDWLRRLDGQVGRYHTLADDVIRGLHAGEVRLAILPRHHVEMARAEGEQWLHYRIPESWTPRLVRGIAIPATAPAPELARRFVDFTGTTDVAAEALRRSRWQPYPLEADRSRLGASFDVEASWIPHALATDTLAAELDGWLERWDLEVRGRGR